MHRRSFLALASGLLLVPLVGRADDLVVRIQQALNRLGFDAGSADGVAGSRTERAIEAFQAEFGYPQTGKATQGVLDQLNAWLKPHGGKMVAAPKSPGSRKHKAIEPAPGRYVKVKA